MDTKSRIFSFIAKIVGIIALLGIMIFTQSASAYVVYARPGAVVVRPAYVHPYYYGGWHRGWGYGWHRGWGWHGGWHRW